MSTSMEFLNELKKRLSTWEGVLGWVYSRVQNPKNFRIEQLY